VMGALFAFLFVLMQAGFERMKAKPHSQEKFAILKRAFDRNRSAARMQAE
jgi:hypothetical protein